MKHEAERVISKHEGIRLVGSGTVKLVITNKRIILERKAGLISKRITPILIVDSQMLDSIAQEKDFTLKIGYKDGENARSARVKATSPTESIEILQKISSILGQRKVAEEGRVLSEKERKLKEVRFKTYLLDSGSKIWEVIALSFAITRFLGSEDWDRVEERFKKLEKTATSLGKENSFRMNDGMALLDSSIKSRSVERVNDAVRQLLGSVGSLLDADTPPDDEWKKYESKARPDWSSLPYLLLFGISVHEVILFEEMGLEMEKNAAVSKLKSLMPVMAEKFDKDLFAKYGSGEVDSLDMAKAASMVEEFSMYLRESLQGSLKQSSLLA